MVHAMCAGCASILRPSDWGGQQVVHDAPKSLAFALCKLPRPALVAGAARGGAALLLSAGEAAVGVAGAAVQALATGVAGNTAATRHAAAVASNAMNNARGVLGALGAAVDTARACIASVPDAAAAGALAPSALVAAAAAADTLLPAIAGGRLPGGRALREDVAVACLGWLAHAARLCLRAHSCAQPPPPPLPTARGRRHSLQPRACS